MPSYEQSTLIHVGEVLAERRYSSSASSKKDSKWQLPRTPNAKALCFSSFKPRPCLTIPTARSLSVLAQTPNRVALRQPNFNPHFPDEALGCAAPADSGVRFSSLYHWNWR